MYIYDQGCARAQCAAAQGLGALGNDAYDVTVSTGVNLCHPVNNQPPSW